MAEEKLLPADALEKNASRPVPPLAGFWHRLGALALDVLLLRLAFQATFVLLKPFYLSLGFRSLIVEWLLIFVYLFLSEGPVGKGKTIGKAVLGIRTSDLAGNPIEPKAAAIRSVFILAIALAFVPAELEALAAIRGGATGLFVFDILVRRLVIAYVIANVILVTLDPIKQGIHDRLAGTLVLREAGESRLAEFLEMAREQGEAMRKRAVQIAAVAFVALLALHAFTDYRRISRDDTQRQLAFLVALDEEMSYKEFRPRVEPQTVQIIDYLAERDGLSTASFHIQFADRPSTDTQTLSFWFRKHTAIEPEDYGTTGEMEALRSRAVEWSREKIVEGRFPFSREMRVHQVRGGDTPTTAIFQPTAVALLFSEEVSLTVFSNSRLDRVELMPLELPEGFYEKERRELGLAKEDGATSPATTPAPREDEKSTGTVVTDEPTTPRE